MSARGHVLASLGSFALLALGCRPDEPTATDHGSDDTGTSGTGLVGTGVDGTGSSSSGTGGSSGDSGSGGGGSDSGSGSLDDTGGTTDTGTSDDGDEPVCGNGIVEGDEACDDAGESPACNDDCTVAICGDGVLNVSAGEVCDDAGPSPRCNASCMPGECGDGMVSVSAGEECDDGDESAACDLDCTLVECGDGLVNATAGEACDGASLGGGTCETLGFAAGTLACGRCSYDTSGCANPPAAPVLQLAISPIKRFDFGWAAVPDADHYELLESAWPGEPYVQIGAAIVGEAYSLWAPLHLRHEASYVLRACNVGGCTESAAVDVVGSLVEAMGYFKASNTGQGDLFGWSMALSADGNTLVVGASNEDSSSTGIDGDQASGAASNAGAVYVFVRDGMGAWTQQAYVKASNTGAGDIFGRSVAVSADGSTLAVGSYLEDGGSTGIGGDQASEASPESGAVYVFVRDGLGAWSQQAYVKASNNDSGDLFGVSVALSADGSTLAVGAEHEDSNATRIGGDQANDVLTNSGATYVFVRDGGGTWTQQAYLKASNPSPIDGFGAALALGANGDTLAVGAWLESSSATGIDGNQASEAASSSGAAYVFVRDASGAWSQQAYVKASNTSANDWFGLSLAVSADGDTLAVGAMYEDSIASGIDGDQTDESGFNAGAVYVFERNVIGQWTQAAYVKASNPDLHDNFGWQVALSGDGNVLAVGAWHEDGNASGVGGDEADDSLAVAGGAYVFVRDGVGAWQQRAYVKASAPDTNDEFGRSLALDAEGRVLAIGAWYEDGDATGVGGDPASDLTVNSGAVYVY